MAKKTRSMRLDQNDWDELRRVGELGRMNRTRLVQEITTHVTPRIRSKDDLQKLLSGMKLRPPSTVVPEVQHR